MLVLGIHGGNAFESDEDPVGFSQHDSAAAILKDGQIIAAIEEERLCRIKHTNCFPENAIRYCLREAGCTLAGVDVIATNRILSHVALESKWRVMNDAAYPVSRDARGYFARPFLTAFGTDVSHKLFFCNHHLAHAWSAYACSGFSASLILTIDGDGDTGSGMVLSADNGSMRLLREFSIPQSLGLLYENTIKLLGYNRFDEYKVMGLAPYGNASAYEELLTSLYRLLEGGDYELQPMIKCLLKFDRAGLVSSARRKGEPFLQRHKDLAAALQAAIERITMHILRHYRESTGHTRLCLAGGVAHNCTMNGHILRSELFEELFVQPAAHDAGGALGAALCAYHQDAPQSLPRHRLQHVFWGTHVGSDAEIATTLDRWSSFLEFEKEEDVARKAARILADGAVIGWIQGRSEFGPRALGNRSILADPRPAENKLRINQMIKKREQYRPFAPAVLAEKLAAYFDVPAGQPEFPFMVIVVPVLEHARQILGATTHVDGTARVQTVSSTTNPLFGNLIRNFGEITGVPVLLNTSFNNNAEPIVDSLDDAVVCFLTTGLDFLVAGNYVVRRKTGQELENQIFGCAIDLPPWRKLVRRPIRSEGSHNWEYLLQSTKSSFFGRRDLPLSEHLFRLLAASTPDVTVEDILLRLAIPSESRMALRAELVGLWSERAITVFPTRTLPAHPGMRSAAHIWTVG